MEAPTSQASSGSAEGSATGTGGITLIFSIAALAIYFIWGQGFVCAWWMWFIFGLLAVLALSKKAQAIQWILGLFLIGITWFASPTFGYTEQQKAQYEQGREDAMPIHYGYSLTPEDAWKDHENGARVDISGYKKYYIRGFKYGAFHDD